MFSLFGISFHAYGLIVGIAAVLAIQLIEYQNTEQQQRGNKKALSESMLWSGLLPIALGAVLGARLWHVATDWYLYQHHLFGIIQVWNGGMSILGAVVGGVLAGYVWTRKKLQQQFGYVLDIVVFGLPIAQAVGRLGNFVNQELYGLPTSLPWGIEIAPWARVAGYEQFSHFHPLFAYEAVMTLGFGVVIWWLSLGSRLGKHEQKKPVEVSSLAWATQHLGSGRLFCWYLWYYSLVRFLLDFIRIEKSPLFELPIGINQAVLLLVIPVAWYCATRSQRTVKTVKKS